MRQEEPAAQRAKLKRKTMPCRLIVNADDFGYSPGVNQAVAELHREGLLTSCSLMVAEPAAGEAAALAQDLPRLAVGLHLTLLRGRSSLPSSAVPALVGSEGRFGDNPLQVGMRYFFSPRARRQLRAEIESQFARFTATGQPLSHVDAHLHFHLHPVVLDAMIAGARDAGCRRLRIPLDSWPIHRRIDAPDAWRQAVLAAVFAIGCAAMRRKARAAGLVSPARVLGLFRTGSLDGPYLSRLVRALPEGTFELHCHPDLETEAGRREIAALRSCEFREALVARGVELATYADLEPA